MLKSINIISIALSISILAACGGGGSDGAIYGSIAVNTATRAGGITARQNSQAEANSAAIGQCGIGCATVVEFVGASQCGALARGIDGAMGWTNGYPQANAEMVAKTACTQRGGILCAVQLSMCNS